MLQRVELSLDSLCQSFAELVERAQRKKAALGLALAKAREAMQQYATLGLAGEALDEAEACLGDLMGGCILEGGWGGPVWTTLLSCSSEIGAMRASLKDSPSHFSFPSSALLFSATQRASAGGISSIPTLPLHAVQQQQQQQQQQALNLSPLRPLAYPPSESPPTFAAAASAAAHPSSLSWLGGGGGAASFDTAYPPPSPSASLLATQAQPSFTLGPNGELSLVASLPPAVLAAAEKSDRLFSLTRVMLEEVHTLRHAVSSALGVEAGQSSRVGALEDTVAALRRDCDLARAEARAAAEREAATVAAADISGRAAKAAAEKLAEELCLAREESRRVGERAKAAERDAVAAGERARAQVGELEASLAAQREAFLADAAARSAAFLRDMGAQRDGMAAMIAEKEAEGRRHAAAVEERNEALARESAEALRRLEVATEAHRQKMEGAAEEAARRLAAAAAEGGAREADILRRAAEDHAALLTEASIQKSALAGQLAAAEGHRLAAMEESERKKQAYLQSLEGAHALHAAAVGEIREAAAGFVLAGQLRDLLAETEKRLVSERRRVITLERALGMPLSMPLTTLHVGGNGTVAAALVLRQWKVRSGCRVQPTH